MAIRPRQSGATVAKNYNECVPGHGANRVTGNVKKKGGNKGIAAAKKARKRAEAEARNGRQGS